MAITAGRAASEYFTFTNNDWETCFQADTTKTPGTTASTNGSSCRAVKVWCATAAVLVRITGIHDLPDGTLDEFYLDVGASQEFLTSGKRGITKVEAKRAVADNGATIKWSVTVQ
jgi:hypothetical protein